MKTTRRKAAAIAACGAALLCATTLAGPASADSTSSVGEKGARTAAAYPLVTVYVWATNVNVRDNTSGPNCNAYPSAANCPGIVRKVSQENITVYCQKRGQPVSDSGYHSEWWVTRTTALTGRAAGPATSTSVATPTSTAYPTARSRVPSR
jgi:hypothetical protein